MTEKCAKWQVYCTQRHFLSSTMWSNFREFRDCASERWHRLRGTIFLQFSGLGPSGGHPGASGRGVWMQVGTKLAGKMGVEREKWRERDAREATTLTVHRSIASSTKPDHPREESHFCWTTPSPRHAISLTTWWASSYHLKCHNFEQLTLQIARRELLAQYANF